MHPMPCGEEALEVVVPAGPGPVQVVVADLVVQVVQLGSQGSPVYLVLVVVVVEVGVLAGLSDTVLCLGGVWGELHEHHEFCSCAAVHLW